MNSDRNFDDLVERFERNVYGGRKGAVRLAVLNRDIQLAIDAFCEQTGRTCLKVLDVGAGLAQIAIGLALKGHQVTINDLSQKMVAQAKSAAEMQGVIDAIRWIEGPYQSLPDLLEDKYDLLICHALIEWLAEPGQLIARLTTLVRPGGMLSITCYNRDALVFRNLLKGNFNFVTRGEFKGDTGSLTPLHPQHPGQVQRLLAENGWQIERISGIRVFNDYAQPRGGNLDTDSVLEQELLFSDQEPFKWLGRYVHFLCRLS